MGWISRLHSLQLTHNSIHFWNNIDLVFKLLQPVEHLMRTRHWSVTKKIPLSIKLPVDLFSFKYFFLYLIRTNIQIFHFPVLLSVSEILFHIIHFYCIPLIGILSLSLLAWLSPSKLNSVLHWRQFLKIDTLYMRDCKSQPVLGRVTKHYFTWKFQDLKWGKNACPLDGEYRIKTYSGSGKLPGPSDIQAGVRNVFRCRRRLRGKHLACQNRLCWVT